jgi:hypothetical protein
VPITSQIMSGAANQIAAAAIDRATLPTVQELAREMRARVAANAMALPSCLACRNLPETCGLRPVLASPSAEVCPSQHFSIEKFVGQCVWHRAGLVRQASQYRVLRRRDCHQGLIANDEVRELL